MPAWLQADDYDHIEERSEFQKKYPVLFEMMQATLKPQRRIFRADFYMVYNDEVLKRINDGFKAISQNQRKLMLSTPEYRQGLWPHLQAQCEAFYDLYLKEDASKEAFIFNRRLW